MARYTCKRCKQELNTTDDPHLCKDVKRRYERFAKNVEVVTKVLNYYYMDQIAGNPDVAAAIVTALSNRGLDKEVIEYGD
jgi:transposase-like protein